MKHIAAAILAILLSSFAQAGEWGMQIHSNSHHFHKRNFLNWNESNPGVAVRYIVDSDLSYQAGRYLNSYSLPGYDSFTSYLAVDYTPLHRGMLSGGIYGGVGTGYDEPWYTLAENGRVVIDRIDKRPVSASGGLLGRIHFDRFNITVRVNPGMAAIGYGVRF